MAKKTRYSIGEVSKICNMSRKALRYYESIGLICSERHEGNNYRYYDRDVFLLVPVIKYYKQMGFTLEEMRSFIEGGDTEVYHSMKNSFLQKIDELSEERLALERKHHSVRDWYSLIVEAQTVIANNVQDISVKYVEAVPYLYQEQHFDNDMKSAIINLDWTNYLEKIGNEITGPVIISFDSLKKRMTNTPQSMCIMQKTLLPIDQEPLYPLGGGLMATCYHIGPHESLPDTYTRLTQWVENNNYILGQGTIERYVTDYWTTSNKSQFVTEVLVDISRKTTQGSS